MHVLEADADAAPRATLMLPPSVHSLSLLRGCSLENDDRASVGEGLIVYCDDEDPALPDWFFAGIAPVVSSRLLAVLTSSGADNFEAFAVTAEDDHGPIATGFYALNVLGRVASIDLSRSAFTTFDGTLFKLDAMRLRPNASPDLMMYRPDEWTLVVLVRDEVAEALRASGVTGLRLTPVDNWANRDF